jgi:hypothetical protein
MFSFDDSDKEQAKELYVKILKESTLSFELQAWSSTSR